MRLPARVSALPLSWKLLLPFLLLMLIVGASGTFFVVRDLARRAEASLSEDLLRTSVDARTLLHDRELSALESVNFAANLQGMAAAIERGDSRVAADLLRSVLALKADLDLLVVTDPRGRALAEYRPPGRRSLEPGGGMWSMHEPVRDALRARLGTRAPGVIRVDGHPLLVIAGPVCSATPCGATGVAVAGLDLRRIAAEIETATGSRGVTIFDADGGARAAAGTRAPPPPIVGDLRIARLDHGEGLVSMYAPFSLRGSPEGLVAVTSDRRDAYAGVRGAGLRLALIVLAAMAGIVAIGTLLSRQILAQVRTLVQTSRALGAGRRAARAPVIADDELGELAHGLNSMAEQLQASYETLESRVTQRTEEVRRLLAERTEFFTSMSHELRTPLAVILSEADLLAETGEPIDVATARATARTIRASGDQLLDVVNEVLEMARADAGRVDVRLQPTALAAVIDHVRPTAEALARTNELTLEIEVPRSLPAVMADPSRLRDVLLNLVDNAVKYTPRGGRVSVEAHAEADSVVITVADDGIGIPRDVGERIFEPFFRVEGVKPLRGQASTGLGLALAKRYVEAQRGTLTFTSAVGVGTAFSIVLPSAGGGRQRRGRRHAS